MIPSQKGQQPHHTDVHQLPGHEGGQPQQRQDTAQQRALGLDLALCLDEAGLVPQVERERRAGDGQFQTQYGGQVMFTAEAAVAAGRGSGSSGSVMA